MRSRRPPVPTGRAPGRPAMALLGALALAASLLPASARAQGPGMRELLEDAAQGAAPVVSVVMVPGSAAPAVRAEPAYPAEPEVAARGVLPATGNLFALPDVFDADDGARVRLDHWAGRPLLLTMTDTACRGTCGYTLQRLAQLAHAAQQRGGAPVEVVVVSIDPRRDDARAWRSFRRRHGLGDPHWHFLVGSMPATRAVAGLLGVRYWNYDEHVMHEFGITLVDASGRIDRALTWANRNTDLFAAASPPCIPPDTRGCQP